MDYRKWNRRYFAYGTIGSFILSLALFVSGLVVGFYLGAYHTQWRLETYILKHPVYSFEETTKALRKSAEDIAQGYREVDTRMNYAAETIDRRYSELDRLSRNLEERMRREAPTVIGR